MQSIFRLATVWLAAITMAAFADRPNILVIVTDDQGFADLGAYAHASIAKTM